MAMRKLGNHGSRLGVPLAAGSSTVRPLGLVVLVAFGIGACPTQIPCWHRCHGLCSTGAKVGIRGCVSLEWSRKYDKGVDGG